MKALYKQEIQDKQLVFLSLHDQFSAKSKKLQVQIPADLGFVNKTQISYHFSVAEFIREDMDRHWQPCAVPLLQCKPVLIPLPLMVRAVLPCAGI